MATIEQAMNRALKKEGEKDRRTDRLYWQRWPKRIRTIVEKNLKQTKHQPRVHEKYEWFAEYFNEAYFENPIPAKNRPYQGFTVNKHVGRTFGRPITIEQ